MKIESGNDSIVFMNIGFALASVIGQKLFPRKPPLSGMYNVRISNILRRLRRTTWFVQWAGGRNQRPSRQHPTTYKLAHTIHCNCSTSNQFTDVQEFWISNTKVMLQTEHGRFDVFVCSLKDTLQKESGALPLGCKMRLVPRPTIGLLQAMQSRKNRRKHTAHISLCKDRHDVQG